MPRSIKVEQRGRIHSPVTAKDIILTMLQQRGTRWASYKALEYHGDALAWLSIAERMTLCNWPPNWAPRPPWCHKTISPRRIDKGRTLGASVFRSDRDLHLRFAVGLH